MIGKIPIVGLSSLNDGDPINIDISPEFGSTNAPIDASSSDRSNVPLRSAIFQLADLVFKAITSPINATIREHMPRYSVISSLLIML